MTFQNQLKKWRGVTRPYERGDFSQPEAAVAFGVPPATYIDWENGRREPRGLAMRLAQLIIAKPRKGRIAATVPRASAAVVTRPQPARRAGKAGGHATPRKRKL